ncbi:MAG: hypothetical protein ACE5JR_12065 [Gemmatimonadota bacterium]
MEKMTFRDVIPARADRVTLLGAALFLSACSSAPQRNEVYRLPAAYNFAFYDTYNEAARSFYAAHYAHFGAYETLLNRGEDAVAEMETFRARVVEYLDHPPRFEPPAEVIAPNWSKMAFETGRAMDWTHMLHSQLYDILTDDRVRDKKTAGERAIAYYLSRANTAFSTRGYGHRWMEGGGAWAGTFRKKYPGINGILWAYHWHHAAVYEALMEPDPEARRQELNRVIAVFKDSVLRNPPKVMPLAAEMAPRFSRMLPAAAQIFDNLHMMHDVVNDIMADASLSRAEKEAEIERMRRNMTYAAQDAVTAPGMPMTGHSMSEGSMRVPTRLPDGSWLPQGHPDARLATMEEFRMPLGVRLEKLPTDSVPAHPRHEGMDR